MEYGVLEELNGKLERNNFECTYFVNSLELASITSWDEYTGTIQ
jgi:hypothetical protein